MEQTKLNIVIKSIALVLLIAIMLPTAVKFAHVFENHKHEVCTNPSDSHFHEIEVDCEFYKFNLNTVFALKTNILKFFTPQTHFKISTSQYYFISDFQRLPFSLRGPPVLI